MSIFHYVVCEAQFLNHNLSHKTEILSHVVKRQSKATDVCMYNTYLYSLCMPQ